MVICEKRCCCNCQHHIQDFHHCTTVPDRKSGECHCSEPKGWICLPPMGNHAHSGWGEHGECELHTWLRELHPRRWECDICGELVAEQTRDVVTRRPRHNTCIPF